MNRIAAPGRAASAQPARDRAATAICAVAVTCFAVHVVLLVATGTSMLAMTLSMLALSALCVACAWRVDGSAARRDHSTTAALGVTMIAVHLLLMSASAGGPGMAHAALRHGSMDHSGMQMASTDGPLSSGAVDVLMNVGLALAAVQVVLAAAALRPRRRVVA